MPRSLTALLPLAAVALTACSSGGSGGSLPDRRAAYLKQAEAVCQQANDKAAALQTPTSLTAIPAFADQGLALVRSTVSSLKAVPPPAEDRAQIEAKVLTPLTSDEATAAAYVDKVKAAAAANDNATLLRLVQERPRTTADVAFMRSYGFDQCIKAAQLSGGG